MKQLLPCILLLLTIPFVHAQNWYKGNLHTHSYWSDGDEFPEMVMDWYKTHGYQFVALSDHNTLAEGERWKLITKSKTYEDGFANYLARFGEPWVVYKMDTGRLHVKLKTLKEYRPLFQDQNFLIIQSEELSDAFDGKPIHMNATNIQSVIPAQGGNSITEVIQRNLDAIMAQREATGVPIMQHLNHPNFRYAVTAQDMMALRGERFFEVYNGHHQVQNYGDSLHIGTEEIWDMVNVSYLEQGKPMLYGIATDDTHHYHMFGPDYSNAGRGWVMVNTNELSAVALINAMEAGNFYASTGVTLSSTSFRDNTLFVEVKTEPSIQYTIEFIGVPKGEGEPRVLQTTSGSSAQFSVTDEYLFVRAKIKSSKVRTNPIAEDENEAAWVQPVMNQGSVK